MGVKTGPQISILICVKHGDATGDVPYYYYYVIDDLVSEARRLGACHA